ncbi:MAG: hypothetical protein LZF62_310121 [Nitrospira sp.]|nr:MAG: hypothetical protein LZF62_310121 [Nitrospira sp.]
MVEGRRLCHRSHRRASSALLVDEREGYAWCASLSIRVVDWPEEKVGVVYRLSLRNWGRGSREEKLPR